MEERPPEAALTSEPAVGSIVVNHYVTRSVKVLAIHEHEVDTITFMNGLSITFYSVASAFASFAVSTWVNAMFQDTWSAPALIMIKFVSPVSLFLALVCVGIGLAIQRKRGSNLKTIRDQSISTVSS